MTARASRPPPRTAPARGPALEPTMTTVTPAELAIARHITTLADESGLIPPERLVGVMRDPATIAP